MPNIVDDRYRILSESEREQLRERFPPTPLYTPHHATAPSYPPIPGYNASTNGSPLDRRVFAVQHRQGNHADDQPEEGDYFSLRSRPPATGSPVILPAALGEGYEPQGSQERTGGAKNDEPFVFDWKRTLMWALYVAEVLFGVFLLALVSKMAVSIMLVGSIGLFGVKIFWKAREALWYAMEIERYEDAALTPERRFEVTSMVARTVGPADQDSDSDLDEERSH